MNTKFNVSMDLDLAQIAPELQGEITDAAAQAVVTKILINGARKAAKDELHRIRKDPQLDADVKAVKMGEQLHRMMLTVMAEANLKVTTVPQDTVIQTELPFEREYRRAA